MQKIFDFPLNFVFLILIHYSLGIRIIELGLSIHSFPLYLNPELWIFNYKACIKLAFPLLRFIFQVTVYCVPCREPVVLLLLMWIRLQRRIPWRSLELLGEEGSRVRYVPVHLFLDPSRRVPPKVYSALIVFQDWSALNWRVKGSCKYILVPQQGTFCPWPLTLDPG